MEVTKDCGAVVPAVEKRPPWVTVAQCRVFAVEGTSCIDKERMVQQLASMNSGALYPVYMDSIERDYKKQFWHRYESCLLSVGYQMVVASKVVTGRALAEDAGMKGVLVDGMDLTVLVEHAVNDGVGELVCAHSFERNLKRLVDVMKMEEVWDRMRKITYVIVIDSDLERSAMIPNVHVVEYPAATVAQKRSRKMQNRCFSEMSKLLGNCVLYNLADFLEPGCGDATAYWEGVTAVMELIQDRLFKDL